MPFSLHFMIFLFFFASSDLLAKFSEFWSMVRGSETGGGKETIQFQSAGAQSQETEQSRSSIARAKTLETATAKRHNTQQLSIVLILKKKQT